MDAKKSPPHPVLLVSVPSEDRSRSVSPQSPSGELRGVRLFRAITRRLSRRRARPDYDSTDSEPSSSSEGHSDSGSGHDSPDGLGDGFRRVLNSLASLSADAAGRRPSDSASDASDSSKKKAGSTPKRILRQPVSYTYVRGLSGLPTIRVPRQGAPQQSLHAGCGR